MSQSKCVICGDLLDEDRGNNAQPYCEGYCCDYCNMNTIVPHRLKLMIDKVDSKEFHHD